MEQRKDLKIQPVQVASTDPAFISGLMPSGSDEAKESGDDTVEDRATSDDAAGSAAVDADGAAEDSPEGPGTADEDAPEASAAADTAGEPEDSADAEDGADDAPDPDKPVFEAIDHRGSITIDAVGVRYTLDDQAAEWRWDEIGAVEYETSRFGRRLTVTVHTPDRRWYPNEVQAPNKSTLKKWTTLLDEILDVYFEDEEEPTGTSEDSADAKGSGASEDGEGAEAGEGASEAATSAGKSEADEPAEKAAEAADSEEPEPAK